MKTWGDEINRLIVETFCFKFLLFKNFSVEKFSLCCSNIFSMTTYELGFENLQWQ